VIVEAVEAAPGDWLPLPRSKHYHHINIYQFVLKNFTNPLVENIKVSFYLTNGTWFFQNSLF
jgi:hypothetical protein